MEIKLAKSIKPIILTLKIGGVWPFDNLKYYKIYRIILIISYLTYILTQFIYVLINIKKIEQSSVPFFNTLSTSCAFVKFLIFNRNVPKIKEMTKMLRKVEFLPRNRKQNVMLEQQISISIIMTRCVWIFTTIILITIAITVYFSRQLPFPAWFPYGFGTKYYEMIFIWQIIIMELIAIGTGGMDVLFAICLLQVACQCRILCDQIYYLDHQSQDITENIKKCLYHHQLIIK